MLGRGNFGEVALARHRISERPYAVKKVRLSLGDAEANNRILREVCTLAGLSHPNIVRYHQSWLETIAETSAGAVIGDTASIVGTMSTGVPSVQGVRRQTSQLGPHVPTTPSFSVGGPSYDQQMDWVAGMDGALRFGGASTGVQQQTSALTAALRRTSSLTLQHTASGGVTKSVPAPQSGGPPTPPHSPPPPGGGAPQGLGDGTVSTGRGPVSWQFVPHNAAASTTPGTSPALSPASSGGAAAAGLLGTSANSSTTVVGAHAAAVAAAGASSGTDGWAMPTVSPRTLSSAHSAPQRPGQHLPMPTPPPPYLGPPTVPQFMGAVAVGGGGGVGGVGGVGFQAWRSGAIGPGVNIGGFVPGNSGALARGGAYGMSPMMSGGVGSKLGVSPAPSTMPENSQVSLYERDAPPRGT